MHRSSVLKSDRRIKPLFLFFSCILLQGSLLSLAGCQKGGPTISAIAIHPSRSEILYLSSNKGFHKSTDQGATWNPIEEGLGTFQILSIVINPAVPSTLYVGTFSDGVYRSVDSGRNWALINSGMRDYIAVVNGLAINPKNPTTLYAATTMGAYRTLDNGGSWERTSDGLDSLFTVAVAVDPENPSIVYAGTSGGIYKSIDAGAHWKAANQGLVLERRADAMSLGVNSIAIDPKRPEWVYVGSARGLFLSRDKGESWNNIDHKGITDPFITTVVINPTQPQTIYAGTNRGLYQSRDAGEKWEKISRFDISAIAIDPVRTEVIYIGTGQGLFRSENGGKVWAEVKTLS
jgi:photosystem II stability/assembly factor-like uncharacterized protein